VLLAARNNGGGAPPLDDDDVDDDTGDDDNGGGRMNVSLTACIKRTKVRSPANKLAITRVRLDWLDNDSVDTADDIPSTSSHSSPSSFISFVVVVMVVVVCVGESLEGVEAPTRVGTADVTVGVAVEEGAGPGNGSLGSKTETVGDDVVVDVVDVGTVGGRVDITVSDTFRVNLLTGNGAVNMGMSDAAPVINDDNDDDDDEDNGEEDGGDGVRGRCDIGDGDKGTESSDAIMIGAVIVRISVTRREYLDDGVAASIGINMSLSSTRPIK
jgi:hypothetical protein